jgi:hypothetical protein
LFCFVNVSGSGCDAVDLGERVWDTPSGSSCSESESAAERDEGIDKHEDDERGAAGEGANKVVMVELEHWGVGAGDGENDDEGVASIVPLLPGFDNLFLESVHSSASTKLALGTAK